MPRSPAVIVALAIATAAATMTGGCGSSKPKTARATTSSTGLGAAVTVAPPPPNCIPVPPPAKPATWIPPSLPMPPDSYTVVELDVPGTQKGGIFVVRGTIRDYLTFFLNEFPHQGWRIGRGESEAGEAEDSFVKENEGGAFRIRMPYCDQTKSELRLTYIPDINAARAAATTTTTTSPPASNP